MKTQYLQKKAKLSQKNDQTYLPFLYSQKTFVQTQKKSIIDKKFDNDKE